MARILVVFFMLAVVGVGFFVGSAVLDGSGTAVWVVGPLVEQVNPPVSPVAPEDTQRQIFTVRPGASALQIGEELKQRDLVRSPVGFRRVVEEKGVGSRLTAGDYELSRSMSTEQIVDTIARGLVRRGPTAIIPEGWRAEQIADRLEANGVASRDEFLRAVADPRSVPNVNTLLGDLPPTLEGYLFPWTYEVKDRVSGAQAAELMVRQFAQRVLDPLRRASANSNLRLTVHQLLTIASIVEREAQRPEERGTVASVYLNRLEHGMPLQADPTVQYVIATRDGRQATQYGYWKQDLTVSELEFDSPFNTYTRTGLPPTPICAPGEAAIMAVVQPPETDYLYFVAKGDGSHLFARTLDEHNDNVAKVNR